MDQLRFTIPEILSLTGLTQCVYILVYMLFRAGDIRRALLPFLYFFVLGIAFFLAFAGEYIGGFIPHFKLWEWAAWFMGPPLSVLLALQVVRIAKVPDLRNFLILLLVPAAFAAAWMLARRFGGCADFACETLPDWLIVTGLVAGACSVPALWTQRAEMARMQAEKTGRDRYWLVLMLVLMNLSFLGVMLLSLTPLLPTGDAALIRTVLGIGLVYLAGTSLFRIYPQAVALVDRRARPPSPEDAVLAKRIEDMLNLQKIYQEPAYTRADLARELKAPETVVSRVINAHFGKSFPQLLNERRVADAKRLLVETDASIKVIAGEVGFNSIASFNRVFRDLTGSTATQFREDNAKTAA